MTRGDLAQERMLLGCGRTALILYTETSLQRNVFTQKRVYRETCLQRTSVRLMKFLSYAMACRQQAG